MTALDCGHTFGDPTVDFTLAMPMPWQLQKVTWWRDGRDRTRVLCPACRAAVSETVCLTAAVMRDQNRAPS